VIETLSGRLKFLLSDLKIKQTDFAQRVDFTQSYISMILSGAKTRPSPRFLEAVSREFNVSLQWLRDGSGEVYFVPGIDLPSADAALLSKYRLLPPDEKAMIDEIVNAFLLKSMTGPGRKESNREVSDHTPGISPGKGSNLKKNKKFIDI
jgi:transcriptional regulator with XRE-family HTH domain